MQPTQEQQPSPPETDPAHHDPAENRPNPGDPGPEVPTPRRQLDPLRDLPGGPPPTRGV